MSILLYDFPSLGGIAHLLLAFEYACRHLNAHGYTVEQEMFSSPGQSHRSCGVVGF